MKQVIQTLKTGVIEVDEVPVPTLHDNFILVQTRASVISAGTEKTKIDMGNKNLLQKAKARPDLVKQVIKKIKTQGLRKTIQTVRTRLNAPSPLGYSSMGEVIAVGGLTEGIKPGDRVACAGAGYANHAEIVAIPKNLVTLVPPGVNDEDAAFTTIGAIALQGLRLAEPKLGETFMVLGLGLIGQIATQLLLANGCQVIATDLDEKLIERARSYGAIGLKSGPDFSSTCHEMTQGQGVDGVLVCAGTASNQPIELCGDVTREKGRVVVVGAVGMNIPREPYFKKEISLTISRSYGPGRYDPNYEEAGNDYPYGYVRFTEQRNMQAFIELVSKDKINVNALISHRFPLDEAAQAYELIEGRKTEPYLGIMLKYADEKHLDQSDPPIQASKHGVQAHQLGLSLFGAGNYATGSLLPLLKNDQRVAFRGLATASGRTAKGVAEQFGFAHCVSNLASLLTEDTHAIMITTRHDTHAHSVIEALKAGKHVYVEKPLALTIDELSDIHYQHQTSPATIMVGFNRRYSPLTTMLIEHFKQIRSPLIVNIRVNAGKLPKDHWIQDPKIGGGRIIGEGCHFIDLASAITQSLPQAVHCTASSKDHKSPLLNDNVGINLSFKNGSIAQITYHADGAPSMPKEYIEVSGGGKSAIIHDFKTLQLFEGDHQVTQQRLSAQDKGQKDMLASWLRSIQHVDSMPVTPSLDYETLMSNSLATIMAVESLAAGIICDVDLSILDKHESDS